MLLLALLLVLGSVGSDALTLALLPTCKLSGAPEFSVVLIVMIDEALDAKLA
jgi:hypothetical protein